MIDENHNPWTTLSSTVQYENPWIEVTEHQVLNPKGGKGIYGTVHFKNLAIGILACEEDKIWLIGQYRYPLNQYSWEIPEGGGKHDTAPLLSAQRELLEEVGATAQNWEEIGRSHLSNSVSDELAIIFFATGLQYEDAQPEDTEELQRKLIGLDEAVAMIQRHEITDSISIMAIQWLHIKRLTLSK